MELQNKIQVNLQAMYLLIKIVITIIMNYYCQY